MTRVVFVTQTAYVGGGMERWLCALTSGLIDASCDVTVALLEGPQFHRPERFLARHPLNTDTVVVRCETQLREERVLALLRLLKEYPGSAVVPVGCADVADAVGLAKTRGVGLRLITCLHGQSSNALSEAGRVAAYTDLAVSVSKLGAESLIREAGMPTDRVRHIPFGVEVGGTRPAWDRGNREELVVVYVGRLDQSEKRVLDIIGIVSALRSEPVRFEIVGEGPERHTLELAMSEPVAAGRVKFRGYIGEDRLSELVYAHADALLIVSSSEGGPITAWEAMAHGVIPVTSDFLGRSREPIWLADVNSLVFPVGDVRAAAEQLRRLLDPGLRMTLSVAARLLPPPYRREAFVEAWRVIVRQALSDEPRGAGIVQEPPSSPGRLKHITAVRRGFHRLRHALGASSQATDAGAEWPSAYKV